MIAPQALDGDDMPLLNMGADAGQRRVRWALVPVGIGDSQSRSAGWAGRWLGMEPPVAGIGILAPTGGAHGKPPHGGAFPVVGHAQYDGEAGATVRAVEERVTIAALVGVGHITETRCAGRHIRRHEDVLHLVPLALRNGEGGAMPDRLPLSADAFDVCRSGASATNALRKAVSLLGSPSISMTTPVVSFQTAPPRPKRLARLYTKGRKPTPWTTP
jgi:hypothetical protein